MKCSICGNPNHNARTCPHKDKDVSRDQALWMKFDNITSKEAAHISHHPQAYNHSSDCSIR